MRLGGFPLPGTGFGLGVSVRLDTKSPTPDPAAGEFGWNGAASTYFSVAPKSEMVVIVLQQVQPYNFALQLALQPTIYGAIERGGRESARSCPAPSPVSFDRPSRALGVPYLASGWRPRSSPRADEHAGRTGTPAGRRTAVRSGRFSSCGEIAGRAGYIHPLSAHLARISRRKSLW